MRDCLGKSLPRSDRCCPEMSETCGNCGAVNGDDDVYCNACSEPLHRGPLLRWVIFRWEVGLAMMGVAGLVGTVIALFQSNFVAALFFLIVSVGGWVGLRLFLD